MNSIEYIGSLIEIRKNGRDSALKIVNQYKKSDDEIFKKVCENFQKLVNEDEEKIKCLKKIKDELEKYNEIKYLMEEYKINSIEELENILKVSENLTNKNIDLSADLGMYQNENENLTKDIDKYWQIENELGCPLDVVFKGMSDYNVEYKIRDKINIGLISNIYKSVDGKFFGKFIPKSYVLGTREDNTIGIQLNQYQKTWWLKGDKDA